MWYKIKNVSTDVCLMNEGVICWIAILFYFIKPYNIAVNVLGNESVWYTITTVPYSTQI